MGLICDKKRACCNIGESSAVLIRQANMIRPPIAADRRPIAILIIGAIDNDARTHDARISSRVMEAAPKIWGAVCFGAACLPVWFQAGT
jgi:hypothetical protein